MQLIIITGMSGAGKASAAKVFDDMNYTVVDNLLPLLLPDLVKQFLSQSESPAYARLAVVMDARSRNFFVGWRDAFDGLKQLGVTPTVLFLDASDTTLVQRFKETRRRHPLFEENEGIIGGLRAERILLEDLKECSDKVIDTSDMDIHDLRNTLTSEFSPDRDQNRGLTITVTSFGFKFGLPLDADLVFDVRFLINPHYVDDLRAYDGRNQLVEEYVMRDPDSGLFLQKLFDLMAWTVPHYIEEGKAYLTTAIGCTGGRHRSVVVAEKLGDYLRALGYRVLVQHRDVAK